jgi:hypothetical protein
MINRPSLSERHLPFFSSLTPEMTALVWERMAERRLVRREQPPESGVDLFRVCQASGFDHATVVLSLARETGEVGVSAIEMLIGHPIERYVRPKLVSQKPPRSPIAPSAPRTSADSQLVVLFVATNPKKPTSSAYQKYKLWRVGATVAECRAAGLPSADVLWDTDPTRGFVRLGTREEWEQQRTSESGEAAS